MIILGIETSCDETAAAVIEGKKVGTQNFAFVRSNVISSQIDIHKKYGGVVPEVAAREHVLNIIPVINEALEKAGLEPHPSPLLGKERGQTLSLLTKEGARGRLDAIAVTIGPGLITSLQSGVETAKVLSYAWNVPLIGINHIEGHIYANFVSLSSKLKAHNSKIFPSMILTVSGGHTMLILMTEHGKYKIIGDTLDDAAGEAFDKAAKLMGIGYPGGPAMAEYAEKHLSSLRGAERRGNPVASSDDSGSSRRRSAPPQDDIVLPRPMINKGYNFSFSGLKTALLYKLQKDPNYKLRISNYCHEFQQSIIDVLIYKTIKAAKEFNVKSIMLAGGVSANTELRSQLKEAVDEQLSQGQLLIPDLKYTTDNAVMIATAGYYKALKNKYTSWDKLKTDCNLELK
jgi:N6-L-threonylcarbamoyladenine synthase